MPHSPSLEAVLGRPAPRALAALRVRLAQLVPTRSWRDLLGAAHDRAFVVAGATTAELLTDLAAAVDQAIERGQSLDEFRRDFMRIIESRGWSGFTGDRAPTGRAWRTRTIWQTNLAVSYAAAAREQLIEAGYKWWIYKHSHLSKEPRPLHLEWDGRIVPADDPWWDAHFPPNGWGCRCYVLGAPTLAAARLLGGRAVGAPTAPDDPTGIDEGWAYAPGASVSPLIRAVAAQATAWSRPILTAYVSTLGRARADELALALRSHPSLEARLEDWAARVRAWRSTDPLRPPELVSLGPVTSRELADLGAPPVLDWAADHAAARAHGPALASIPRGLRHAQITRAPDGTVIVTLRDGRTYRFGVDPRHQALVLLP